MELKGKLLIPLGQVTVWNGLNDAEALRTSLPGCESIEKTAEDHYKLVMVATVGPVKARFSGSLALSNVLAPNTYTLTFEGSGGGVGFGKGWADVELSEVDGGTSLAYQAKVLVGGKLAQVGSRLISGVAERMAAEFFTRFQEHLMSAELAPNAPMPQPKELLEVLADASVKAVGTSRWKFWVRT